jgi:hypothetical protein
MCNEPVVGTDAGLQETVSNGGLPAPTTEATTTHLYKTQHGI